MFAKVIAFPTLSGSIMRPNPHVSKGVLQDRCKVIGRDNEIFKVTNDGNAIPKSPSSAQGTKQGSGGDISKGYKDGNMEDAHTNLPSGGIND